MIWIVEKMQIGPHFSSGIIPHFFYIVEKYFYIFGSTFSLHFHSARLLRKQTILWSSLSCAAQCKMQRKCRENVEMQKKCGDFGAQSYLWIPSTFFAFSTFLQQLFVDFFKFFDRSNLKCRANVQNVDAAPSGAVGPVQLNAKCREYVEKMQKCRKNVEISKRNHTFAFLPHFSHSLHFCSGLLIL